MSHEIRTRLCQRDVFFQKASNQSAIQCTGNTIDDTSSLTLNVQYQSDALI
jgi:hypothetical protein